MRPDRDRLTWLPLQAGLVVAVLAGLAAAVTTAAALRMEAPLERERAAGQGAVLELLSEEIGRAVALGIPLGAIPDLQPQLETTLGQLPNLSAVAIAMPDGFRAAAGTPGPADIPSTVALGEGTLTITRTPDGSLRRLLLATAGAAALGGGLLAAVLARALVCRPARRAEARLARHLAETAAGDFARPAEPVAGLPAEALAAELEEWRARVAQRRRLLEQQAAGVRAIDFDGTIGAQVDAILARADAGRLLPDPSG